MSETTNEMIDPSTLTGAMKERWEMAQTLASVPCTACGETAGAERALLDVRTGSLICVNCGMKTKLFAGDGDDVVTDCKGCHEELSEWVDYCPDCAPNYDCVRSRDVWENHEDPVMRARVAIAREGLRRFLAAPRSSDGFRPDLDNFEREARRDFDALYG